MDDDLLARLTGVYRDLHQHPELSGQEHRTAGVVAAWLRDLGHEVLEGVGGTGVVGIQRNGAGPTVVLRADMDALPVSEETGLPYASTVEGVMHACGHDGTSPACSAPPPRWMPSATPGVELSSACSSRPRRR